MTYLIPAVVLVGAGCMLDFLLTLGVIRRLREHTELLSRGSTGAGAMGGPPSLAVGAEVGEFAVASVDGERLSRGQLTGETLVAFFSPGCPSCQENLPKFVKFARAMPGGKDRVLAVVVGGPDEDEVAAPVAELSPVARVVVEDRGGALNTAFEVRAYPTILMVAPDDNGRLTVRDNDVELDQPALVS